MTIFFRAVTLFAGFLVFVGTSYDLYLTSKYEKKCSVSKFSKELNSESSSGIGCTTYDLSNASPDKKNSAIGIPMPTGNFLLFKELKHNAWDFRSLF